jgi:hypothetical protein
MCIFPSEKDVDFLARKSGGEMSTELGNVPSTWNRDEEIQMGSRKIYGIFFLKRPSKDVKKEGGNGY